jgi:hypothetical protein
LTNKTDDYVIDDTQLVDLTKPDIGLIPGSGLISPRIRLPKLENESYFTQYKLMMQRMKDTKKGKVVGVNN